MNDEHYAYYFLYDLMSDYENSYLDAISLDPIVVRVCLDKTHALSRALMCVLDLTNDSGLDTITKFDALVSEHVSMIRFLDENEQDAITKIVEQIENFKATECEKYLAFVLKCCKMPYSTNNTTDNNTT